LDYAKLRGQIRAVYHTQASFAKSMGLSECALSQKLNGHTEWTADEIRKACELLEIPADELHIYFFT
jgi:transcriptional regulator with XRE-family HTH domain